MRERGGGKPSSPLTLRGFKAVSEKASKSEWRGNSRAFDRTLLEQTLLGQVCYSREGRLGGAANAFCLEPIGDEALCFRVNAR